MPKKKLVIDDEVEQAIDEALKADSFDVIGNDGGVIRTYSVEIHGADAEKLANQFASKIGGTVS